MQTIYKNNFSFVYGFSISFHFVVIQIKIDTCERENSLLFCWEMSGTGWYWIGFDWDCHLGYTNNIAYIQINLCPKTA